MLVVASERQNEQSARVHRAELEQRLAALGTAIGDRLSDEQRVWLVEFIDVGEYGTALEMIADWLSECSASISASERGEAEALATAMGNRDRVMGPLDLCTE